MKNFMKPVLAVVLMAALFIVSGCATEPVAQDSLLETQISSDAHKTDYNFQSKLRGENEVPAVETDAVGQAVVRISRDGTEIYYKLIVANLDNAVAAHFHMAPEGDNGMVVAFLYSGEPSGTTNGILVEGTLTAEDVIGPLDGDFEALKDRIRRGLIYINIHTTTVPSGELRGQL